MADFFQALKQEHMDFIREQHIFFVATAPAGTRVSLSPKGMDTLRIINETQIAYLDLTGSGNETATHLRHDARMTMMFCSFGKHPLILRLYGRGFNITPRQPQWACWEENFPSYPGARQIIALDIESVQTSCGYSIPYYDYRGERDTLQRWAEKKGRQGIENYWKEKNLASIDGLASGLLDDSD